MSDYSKSSNEVDSMNGSGTKCTPETGLDDFPRIGPERCLLSSWEVAIFSRLGATFFDIYLSVLDGMID